MSKLHPSYKANGLRRAASRQKAIRSRLSRVQLRSVTTGEVTYRSRVMRTGLGWKTFFATVDRTSRDEYFVDLVSWGRSKGLEVATSEIENY